MTKEELEIDNKRLDFNEKVQLVVKKEELKKQDIRLNKLCFDYQEKEKQIDELKAKIKVLEQNLEDTEICENGLKNRIAELEAQIEKMKCCANCKNRKWDKENKEFICGYVCKNREYWELRR